MDIIKETKEQKEDRFSSWMRNVQDRFKHLTKEEIREELHKTSFPFAVLFTNVFGDFNIGTGIRNANAFNAECVYYLGSKRFDRRGAVGVQNYTDLNYLSTVDDLIKLKSYYNFVAVDNIVGSKPLIDHEWNFEKKTLMIFGEEGSGISKEILDLCDSLVEIPMFGSVRSLNVGTASGILMNDFVTKYNYKKGK